MAKNRTPRVFVVQMPKPKGDGWVPNLEPATSFGRLEFIFSAGEHIYASPQDGLLTLRRKLVDFDPNEDYLLWANFGDPACLWLTIMFIVANKSPKIKFLYWSRGRVGDKMSNDNGYYFPVEMDVSQFSNL